MGHERRQPMAVQPLTCLVVQHLSDPFARLHLLDKVATLKDLQDVVDHSCVCACHSAQRERERDRSEQGLNRDGRNPETY